MKKNNWLYSIGFLVFIFCLSNKMWAQRDVSESIGTPYVGLQYGIHLPGKDLADRYGLIHSVGSHAGYKTAQNWVFGLDGNFLFGNQLKIDGLMQNLMDNQGTITNTSGQPADVQAFFRGFNANISVGKIFSVFGPNPNSGIMVKVSAGYLFHKTKIEAPRDEVTQLRKEYLKGYDRLTIGFNIDEFIGYSFMANRGVYNFYGGFYFQQGFTRNQRTIFWDHPNEKVDNGLRLDLLFGIRVGWLVPIYQRQPKEFYFN